MRLTSLLRCCADRESGQLRLNKAELDGPHKDRKCKHFDDDFYIEIFFDTSPSCEVN